MWFSTTSCCAAGELCCLMRHIANLQLMFSTCFAERIFVYFFWKTRFVSFKWSLPEFQRLRNKYAKYNVSLWICNSSPIKNNFQSPTFSTNVNKVLAFFSSTFCELFCAKHHELYVPYPEPKDKARIKLVPSDSIWVMAHSDWTLIVFLPI
jgi:hypothetical protein